MKFTSPETKVRATSLDALRGYAILTMVLSGTIAFGILPGWMYHAQTPPPTNAFNPEVFGITWVDLVFPFFLFSMGAAFPFSIGQKLEKGGSVWNLLFNGLLRGLRLAFFAIFIQHMYPWVISNPQDYRAWLTTLAAFMLMFPMFMRLPWQMPVWIRYAIQAIAYGIAVCMLLLVPYANDRIFSLGFSNIIILVLANMAIFGTLIYVLTWKNSWMRMAILPFVMAVFLGGTTNPESWNAALFNYSPVSWLYSFRYLKYLFIVIPGTIAGEYLIGWMKSYRPAEKDEIEREKRSAFFQLFIGIALIVFNLYGLYARQLMFNLTGTAVLLFLGYWSIRQADTSMTKLWKKLFVAGAYLLLLGLFFEAFEGGIRKDPSTYSYYFVTSGLAFFALIIFSVLCDYFRCRKGTAFLSMSGQNPMIAYVGSSMVIQPLLHIVQVYPLLDRLSDSAWPGFFRGVIITGLVTLMTMFFTKIKWFWRT